MRSAPVTIYLDGAVLQCEAGASVASVLLANNVYAFSTHPVDESPRGAFCMMGACQACRVLVDGRWQQACQCTVSDGMQLQLSAAMKTPPSGNGAEQSTPGKSDAVPRVATHTETTWRNTDRQCDE